MIEVLAVLALLAIAGAGVWLRIRTIERVADDLAARFERNAAEDRVQGSRIEDIEADVERIRKHEGW